MHVRFCLVSQIRKSTVQMVAGTNADLQLEVPDVRPACPRNDIPTSDGTGCAYKNDPHPVSEKRGPFETCEFFKGWHFHCTPPLFLSEPFKCCSGSFESFPKRRVGQCDKPKEHVSRCALSLIGFSKILVHIPCAMLWVSLHGYEFQRQATMHVTDGHEDESWRNFFGVFYRVQHFRQNKVSFHDFFRQMIQGPQLRRVEDRQASNDVQWP